MREIHALSVPKPGAPRREGRTIPGRAE